MNWLEAIEVMRSGANVQRRSEQTRKQISPGVWECGEEPCMLAHAWTVDERPVLVFRGADSGVLFVPDSDDREATDWVVVE